MPVKSAARVVDMLLAVAESDEGLGVTDLARRLAIPKSSAWNIAETLLGRRFLERTSAGRLVLGDRLFDIGRSVGFDRSVRTIAHPLMTELMEKTGESVFLGVLTPEFEVLLVHKVLGPHVIRYDADVGQTMPAYCTASGRVLLAHLPPDRLAHYLKTTPRQQLTDRTVIDRRRLLAEIEEVQRTGVAFNFGERIAGASGIAAPVHAGWGGVIAELGLAGPTARLLTKRTELARLVRSTAERISALLGGRVLGNADGGRRSPGGDVKMRPGPRARVPVSPGGGRERRRHVADSRKGTHE